MYQILEKRRLNETTSLMRVLAPRVAKKAGPGQFIILRIDENGERIPLTIAGYDRESGSVTIIFQKVGKTTIQLDELERGRQPAGLRRPPRPRQRVRRRQGQARGRHRRRSGHRHRLPAGRGAHASWARRWT